MRINNIAVVIGHHKNAQGAISDTLGLSEWAFYKRVSSYLKGVDIYYHNENISGYTSRIKDTAKRLNKEDYKLVIECHFNSFEPPANGCETLYFYRSKQGKFYAKHFSELVSEKLGLKLRNGGLKALTNKKDRGFASVYLPKAPTILIEPFFGSNKKDCDLIGSPKKLAEVINTFVQKYVSL
tara:strand:- start:693 stop:1238 length:546 start_codon:yes stop_codon:yes gene_type:complete